jgi:hypothetical protein
VQSVLEMQRQMSGKLPLLNSVADHLYGCWIKNLAV